MDSFWDQVQVGSLNECWPWQGEFLGKYGLYCNEDGSIFAHRQAYILTHGATGDLHVCHHCDNPSCCNPAHLWLGTRSDNLKDAVVKGRLTNHNPGGSSAKQRNGKGNYKCESSCTCGRHTSPKRGGWETRRKTTHKESNERV